MGTLGTFDSFTTARLGIYAAMQGLQVTGNNISNINTSGYTRQRIDQVSFKTGGNDRYSSYWQNHIGSGALVNNINQIRDPYLDIRYRTTNADTGYSNAMLEGLNEIAAILDEVGKGGKDDTTYGDGLLFAELQNLAEKLRSFSADPTYDNDTLVRGAAENVTQLFRLYADKLEKLRQDADKNLKDSVSEVNGILYTIRDLNKSIRQCDIHGDNALELRDERNRQIDALSQFMNINVQYSMEDVGAGVQVEKLTILLGDSNPDANVETDSSMLVDGLYATQLSIQEEKPKVNPYFDSNDPDYADLRGFLYLKPRASDTDPLEGTNMVEEAEMVPNDNSTIQLGKLLNLHNVEWKNSTTIWKEIPGGQLAQKASYSFTIASEGWSAGETFKVGDKEFTVGTDITVNYANDPARMATFIAAELSTQVGNDYDYVITSNGAKIVYTAKQAGALKDEDGNGDGPQAKPTPTVENGGTKLTVTEDEDAAFDGQDGQPPDEDSKTTDSYGTETSISYVELNGSWQQIIVITEHTREIALDDNDLHGKLQAQRELLTGEGEFASANDVIIDENAMTERGIPYYQKSFDLLAQQFANQYNQLNQGYKIDHKGNYLDEDNNVIAGLELAGKPVNRYEPLTQEQKDALIAGDCYKMDSEGTPILDADGNKIADVNRWLEAKGAVAMGGALFSNSNDGDDTTGITAANINVSHSWSSGAVQLVPKYEVLFADDEGGEDGEGMAHSTQNINANHMVSLIDKALTYNPKDLYGDSDADGPLLFTGSFNDMFSNMMGVLGKDQNINNTQLNTNYTTLVNLDSNREGVSGVDLNDEAMNLMTYQKAYSAACRVMTVVDSVLERLINNTGVTV